MVIERATKKEKDNMGIVGFDEASWSIITKPVRSLLAGPTLSHHKSQHSEIDSLHG